MKSRNITRSAAIAFLRQFEKPSQALRANKALAWIFDVAEMRTRGVWGMQGKVHGSSSANVPKDIREELLAADPEGMFLIRNKSLTPVPVLQKAADAVVHYNESAIADIGGEGPKGKIWIDAIQVERYLNGEPALNDTQLKRVKNVSKKADFSALTNDIEPQRVLDVLAFLKAHKEDNHILRFFHLRGDMQTVDKRLKTDSQRQAHGNMQLRQDVAATDRKYRFMDEELHLHEDAQKIADAVISYGKNFRASLLNRAVKVMESEAKAKLATGSEIGIR